MTDNNIINTTIDLETLNNETDGEYVIHNINKSIHPVHVTFRRLVNQYADNLSIDASQAAIELMKILQKDFPKVILVKRIKMEGEPSGYRYKKYARMDAISKVSHVISTKRFNNRKRGGGGDGDVGSGGGTPGGKKVATSPRKKKAKVVATAAEIVNQMVDNNDNSMMPPVVPVHPEENVNIPGLGIVPIVNETELQNMDPSNETEMVTNDSTQDEIVKREEEEAVAI